MLDVETTKATHQRLKDVRLVGVGWLPLDGQHPPVFDVIDHNAKTDFAALDRLRTWLRDYDGEVIGHNLTYDIGVLQAHGIRMPKATFFDTFIGLRCYNENETRNDLKSWAINLGYPPYWHDFERVLDTIGPENMPIPDLETYNHYDLCSTADLSAWLRPRIKQEAIFRLECETVPRVARMQAHGLKLDHGRLQAHYDRLERERARIEAKIQERCGPLNFNSHVQISRLLFDQLELPEDDTLGRSTREEVLKKLDHPVARALLRRRKLSKIVTSYLRPLERAVDGDGIVRGNFMVHGTESGRLSCRQPPLQTIPEEIRDVFVPQYGVFVWVDLEQIEYRIIADIFGERKLIERIKAGQDVHEATAELLFGRCDATLRKLAKTLNYAVAYGAGPGRVIATARRYGIRLTYRRAWNLLDDYEYQFPSIKRGITRVHRQVDRGEVIVSPFGRRRRFSLEAGEVNRGTLARMHREGFNAIPQGMGHDITLGLWVDLDDALRSAGVTYEFANELHDELVIDTTPGDTRKVVRVCEDVVKDLNRRIEQRFGYRFEVPIEAKVSVGERWH